MDVGLVMLLLLLLLLCGTFSGTSGEVIGMVGSLKGKSEVCPAVALAPRPGIEACDAVWTTLHLYPPARHYHFRRKSEDFVAGVIIGLKQQEE